MSRSLFAYSFIHVKEVADCCYISQLSSKASLCDDITDGFRPMKISSWDRASPRYIPHVMLVLANDLEMASIVIHQ